MSAGNVFEAMIDAAEALDRKLGPARVAELKESYEAFASCGMDATQIKTVMALTAHEMRLIQRA